MNTLFGTDGIRGRVGAGWFVPQELIRLSSAFGHWMKKKYGEHPHVLIIHDTRESVSLIKKYLIDTLLGQGIIIQDALILPTPAAVHIMQGYPSFDCALVISASHNPYHDNGIKIIDRITGKLTRDDERAIEHYLTFPPLLSSSPGQIIHFKDAEEYYCNALIQRFDPCLLQGIAVALDTAHGATYRVAEKIFSALGALVITLNNTPNGKNINEHCGSTYPQALQHVLCNHSGKPSIGFAFDGDGDRVIAVNSNGEIKDGDDLLALLLNHPAYQTTRTIVGTLMSNQGFEIYLKQQNKNLLRTPVGDRHVLEQLLHQNLLLGGEPSGHIILNDLLTTGDGILVALRVLEVVRYTNNWHLTTFDKYPQVLINVPCLQKRNLNDPPLKQVLEQAYQELTNERLIVRFSGTENCLRIMVEATTETKARTIGNRLAQILHKELNT
jgi:phosphoglucosamine mutase